MNDLLLQLGSNDRARAVWRSLGLPLPLPAPLRRAEGPVRARALSDQKVLYAAAGAASLATVCAQSLARAGADVYLDDFEGLRARFKAPCEAFGRGPHALALLNESTRLDAVLLDLCDARAVRSLRVLFEIAEKSLLRLRSCARVLVLARREDEAIEQPTSEEEAAVQHAIDGFVRSLAKELGRGGSTVNLLRVHSAAPDRAGPALVWLLSERSAFVTGQCLRVGPEARSTDEPPSSERALEGKVAIVTGAARGIGAATALALSREGARVWCVDREDDGALSAVARRAGGGALVIDVAAQDAGRRLREALGDEPLDLLVHNAGVTRDKTLARMSDAQWDEVLSVNLDAIVRSTRELEPSLRRGARVIALSSVSGIAGNVGQCAYAAAKSGVIGWVRAMSARWAPRGITVNAVAPGFIETRMTEAMPVALREAARRLSALAQGGLPEDVAETIVFLASAGAQGITGATLRVCGGAFIGA